MLWHTVIKTKSHWVLRIHKCIICMRLCIDERNYNESDIYVKKKKKSVRFICSLARFGKCNFFSKSLNFVSWHLTFFITGKLAHKLFCSNVWLSCPPFCKSTRQLTLYIDLRNHRVYFRRVFFAKGFFSFQSCLN